MGYKKKWGTKMTKNNHSSKNINRENQIFDFSFDSVDSTSLMWISTLSRKKLDFFCSNIEKILKKKKVKFFGEGLYIFFFNSASGPVLYNDQICLVYVSYNFKTKINIYKKISEKKFENFSKKFRRKYFFFHIFFCQNSK